MTAITPVGVGTTANDGTGDSLRSLAQTINTIIGLLNAGTAGQNPTVQYATTAALATNTYSAGVITASANGALSVDGSAVAVADRILVKDEASALKNGVYVVTATGSAGAVFVLTRADDYDVWDNLAGTMVLVQNGTANAETAWQSTANNAGTLGTTAIAYIQPSSGTITATIWAYLAATSAYMGGLLATASRAALIATIAATGQLQGFKNRAINGDFAVDQRNAGGAQAITTTQTYGVDRWATYATSAVSGTVTAQRTDTAFATEAKYCLRLARSSGSFTGGFVCAQALETANIADLAGRRVVLSFKARKGSAYAAGLTADLITGTGTDQSLGMMTAGTWTSYAAAASSTVTLTTSFQTFSITATLGASVSQIGLRFDTGAFSGAGGANDYVDITDVQIEPADATTGVATQFERRPIGVELALCKRYYNRCGRTMSGRWFDANTCHIGCAFAVEMRTAPTVTLLTSTPSVTEFYISGRVGSGSTIGSAISSPRGVMVGMAGFTGATIGGTALGDTTDIFECSAEL